MRSVLAAAIVVFATVWTGPVALASPPTVFSGTWEAIDVDGSYMTFSVSGRSTSVRAVLVDRFASVCANNGAVAGPTAVRGVGTVSGASLTWSFDGIRCAGGVVLPGGTITFTHDAATDTLFDGQVIWYRLSM